MSTCVGSVGNIDHFIKEGRLEVDYEQSMVLMKHTEVVVLE